MGGSLRPPIFQDKGLVTMFNPYDELMRDEFGHHRSWSIYVQVAYKLGVRASRDQVTLLINPYDRTSKLYRAFSLGFKMKEWQDAPKHKQTHTDSARVKRRPRKNRRLE
jgi:hypothetical protein